MGKIDFSSFSTFFLRYDLLVYFIRTKTTNNKDEK